MSIFCSFMCLVILLFFAIFMAIPVEVELKLKPDMIFEA